MIFATIFSAETERAQPHKQNIPGAPSLKTRRQNESLSHPDEELYPNFCKGLPLKKCFEKVDVQNNIVGGSGRHCQLTKPIPECNWWQNSKMNYSRLEYVHS